MSAKAAPSCPNCHAPLPLTGNVPVITCEYCGRQVMREQPQPTSGPPGGVQIRIDRALQVRPVQAQVPKVKGLIIAFAVLPLLIGGIVMAVVVSKAQKAATRGGSSPGGGGYAPKGEHLQWDNLPPVAVDIDRDGVEDFVGRYRVLEKGDSWVYVGAFDGKKLKRIWKAGSFGTASDARAIRFTVSGDRVLATDASNFVYVIELGTGKELRNLRLTDKVEELCPYPEDASKVWIAVADEQNVTLDMATGTSQLTGRPGWCSEEVSLHANSSCWHAEYHRNHLARAECRPAENAPGLSGFKAQYVLADGGHQIAVGIKHPGSRVPMLMGFTGSGRNATVTWSRNVAEDARESDVQVADLIDGRAILLYQTKQQGWRLAGLDAATGNTVYDLVIPRSDKGSGPSSMLLTASRIYVPHWTWLDVFETATGEHLGTVGIW